LKWRHHLENEPHQRSNNQTGKKASNRFVRTQYRLSIHEGSTGINGATPSKDYRCGVGAVGWKNEVQRKDDVNGRYRHRNSTHYWIVEKIKASVGSTVTHLRTRRLQLLSSTCTIIVDDSIIFDEEIATRWTFVVKTFFEESLYHAR